jgi:hypothetical protein
MVVAEHFEDVHHCEAGIVLPRTFPLHDGQESVQGWFEF